MKDPQNNRKPARKSPPRKKQISEAKAPGDRQRKYISPDKPGSDRKFDKRDKPDNTRAVGKAAKPDKDAKSGKGKDFVKGENSDKDRRFDKDKRFDKDRRFDKAGKFDKESDTTRTSSYSKLKKFDKESDTNTDRKFDKDKKVVKEEKSYKEVGSGREKKFDRKKSSKAFKASELMRLNKYIAHAGICSRREADKLIEAGLVTVNGQIVSDLGTRVNPDDDVRYNGERLGNERKVYLLLNKPKDYVTTVEDPHAKKTVMELVSKACKERIYPVGRLDKNTTGVLLLTNDGELTRKLTHPSFNKKKIYHVYLDKNLTQADMNKISEGVELEDGFIQVDAIAYASRESKKEVGLEIHSGKNRVVRRIFEHMDYKVTKLDRVYFAGLTKKNLPRGRWRFLTEQEIKMLKMNAFE